MPLECAEKAKDVESWPLTTVIIECQRCSRRKEWSRAKFLTEYSGMMLPDVLRAVASDCDSVHRLSAKPCQAVYPQLAQSGTATGA